jgi:hypothetical protein
LIQINQWERWVACGDNHGELVCRKTLKVFLEFLKDFKPEHRIHLGDNYDFRNLRRGAEPSEEDDSLDRDWQLGNEFFDLYRPTVFLTGNHDHRIIKASQDWRGLVRHYAQQGIDDITKRLHSMKCQFIPYHYRDGIYKLGDMLFLHGYAASESAVKHHAQVYGNCIIGHLHVIDEERARRLDGAIARCVGCMANFELMHYADQRTATLRWANGWAYGFVHKKTGKTISFQARKTGDSWIIPSDFKSYENKQ